MTCRRLAVRVASFCLVFWTLLQPGHAAVLMVDSKTPSTMPDGLSWTNAFPGIVDALAVAMPGDEVWVAAGSYTNTLLLPMNTALFGGFAGTETAREQRDWRTNLTVIDGGGAAVPVITMPSGASAQTQVNGFTVQHGQGDLGAGMFCSGGSPVIMNNRFHELGTNQTIGAGIYVGSGEPDIRTNLFDHNRALQGAGIFMFQGAASVIGNTFRDNSAVQAAALALDLCTGVVEANLFLRNACDQSSTVDSNGSWVEFTRNRFVNNRAGSAGSSGIGCTTNGLALIANNLFALGIASTGANDRASSVNVDASVIALIWNNTFMDNESHVFGLPAVAAPFGAQIVNNLFVREEWALSLPADSSSDIRHNCFFRCAYPWGNQAALVGLNGNLAADPGLAAEPPIFQPRIRPDSPCRNAGENGVLAGTLDLDGKLRTQDGAVDIGAFEATDQLAAIPPLQRLYVTPGGNATNSGTAWTSSLDSIALALALADPDRDTEVWVKTGLWRESVTVPPFIKLYGGFTGREETLEERDYRNNPTTLEGGGTNSAVQFDGTGPFALLDGFTVTHGNAPKGGGIYGYAASPFVLNNTITNNSADTASVARAGFGGGICFEFGGPVISNNVVSGNTAKLGGGIYVHTLATISATIADNLIQQNNADPTLSLEHKLGGAGVYVDGCADLANNLITDNVVRAGPAGNSVPLSGGGVFLSAIAPSSVRHNTVLRNRLVSSPGTPVHGGGIHAEGTGVAVANNIIMGNSSGVDLLGAFSPVVRANCVFNNRNGDFTQPEFSVGNLLVDPLLTSDLTLATNSPCLDAGDPTLTDLHYLDLAGRPRWIGAGPDIGAIELVPTGFDDMARLLLSLPLTFHTEGGLTYVTYAIQCLPCGTYEGTSPLTITDGVMGLETGFQAPPPGRPCSQVCSATNGAPVFGVLAPGNYALQLTENGAPIVRLPFNVPLTSNPLLSLNETAGQTKLEARYAEGLTYEVQSSGNLRDWTTVHTVSPGSPALFKLPFPVGGSDFLAFRAITLP